MSSTGYYSTIAPQAPSAMAAHAPLMIDVLASIEQRIGQAELGSESLQQAFAVSRASLYRLFQSRGGVASYIREQRLSTAHRYLQAYPDCSLTWLLYAMGFASERRVQRAFQQRFGMPPMQWRHQCHATPRRVASHTPTPRRGHYVPMWRFMRELSHDTQCAEVPVRTGMLPLHSAALVHTEPLRRLGQPLRARAIELEYADR